MPHTTLNFLARMVGNVQTDRGGYSKFRHMPEPKSPSRDQVLYEKYVYLRVYSSALLQEAQELRKTSSKLRNTNAALAYDLQLIRAVGYFPNRTNQNHFQDLASDEYV